jgi:hypothetical protein
MRSRPLSTPSLRPHRSRRRSARGGQGLVEFALVAPIFLLSVFLLVDFGRLLYAYSGISSAAREGARILSLKSDQFTDCYAFAQMEKVGQGFPLNADPNSLDTNNDPNLPTAGYNPTSPVPVGKGYIYIYPSVSSSAPTDVNCTSSTARRVSATTKSVAVEIQYHFTPLTPLVGSIIPNITLRTISVTQTEY